MKKVFLLTLPFIFFGLQLEGQVIGPVGGGGISLPGDCGSGSNITPIWFSGNHKITSACTDVNIGIGTNPPLYPLHVFGQANVDWLTTEQIGIGTTTPGNVALKINSVGASYFALAHLKQAGVSPYKKMIFMEIEDPSVELIKVVNSQTGHTPFYLNADGKMVIKNGVQTILQLDSDGMLRARRIKVDTDVWPDYVFADDYALMPLKDVEIFINKENHLPNIPSQKEIISNGLDLGEMNILLLEKIEELMLYTIQQQKEIDELKQIIKKK